MQEPVGRGQEPVGRVQEPLAPQQGAGACGTTAGRLGADESMCYAAWVTVVSKRLLADKPLVTPLHPFNRSASNPPRPTWTRPGVIGTRGGGMGARGRGGWSWGGCSRSHGAAAPRSRKTELRAQGPQLCKPVVCRRLSLSGCARDFQHRLNQSSWMSGGGRPPWPLLSSALVVDDRAAGCRPPLCGGSTLLTWVLAQSLSPLVPDLQTFLAARDTRAGWSGW